MSESECLEAFDSLLVFIEEKEKNLENATVEDAMYIVDTLNAAIGAVVHMLHDFANEPERVSPLVHLRNNMQVIISRWERNCRLIPDRLQRCPTFETGNRGRPAYILEQEQVEMLLDLGFSCKGISSMFGVSRYTLYRRMDSWGLTGPNRFTDLSDDDLDELVRSIYSNHPHSGENLAIVIVYICKMNGLS